MLNKRRPPFITEFASDSVKLVLEQVVLILVDADGRAPHVGIVFVPTVSARYDFTVIPILKLNNQHVTVVTMTRSNSFIASGINKPKACIAFPRSIDLPPNSAVDLEVNHSWQVSIGQQ